MTCNEFRDRVEDVLDGLLPVEDAAHLESHRDECSDCATQWDEAGRFRDLLAREGRAALGAWEARRLAVNAATLLPEEAAGAAPAPRRRFTVLRLAAAAAVVATAAIFGTELLGQSGPVALAAGVQTRLDPGSEATFGHECRLVVEDRAATVTLRRGAGADGGDVLEMERGVALIRVHAEHALAVATAQGTARAVGATFVVDVRSDGAVAIDVVTGRVRLERGAEPVVVARSGERVEVDKGGRAHVVSRARIDELEVIDSRRADEALALRAELARAEEQLDAYVAAAQAAGTLPEAGDELPFDELGRALRTLTDRSIPWGDAKRNEAMAFFLLNAERIRKEFGASDPMKALEKPAFVSAIAQGYFEALAPDASESHLIAAVEGVRAACARVEAAAAASPLPTEQATSFQRALVDIIRTVDTHLGGAAAVDVVHAFRGVWDGPRPFVQTIDDRLESKMFGYWEHFGLDDDQTNRLAELVRTYIAETIATQGQVAAGLTPEEAERVLFPSMGWGAFGSRWGGGERKGERKTGEPAVGGAGAAVTGDRDGDGDGDAERNPWRRSMEKQPERSASEVVSERLRELDARLHLAEPRRRYERALFNLLTPEQSKKAFAGPARLLTFRERTAE